MVDEERSRRGLLAALGIAEPVPRAWALYDWANSAIYTTIVGAVFPTYFLSVVAKAAGEDQGARWFGWATTIAIALIALSAPVLGAFADLRAAKKPLLAAFVALGVAGCCGLFFVGEGDVVLALVLFGVVNVGAAGSLVFYDSLLPHVVPPERVDRLSAVGFSLGYLGGGLLLLLQILWIQKPGWFGLPEDGSTLPVRLAFLTAGLWWLVFSLPLFRRVPEPALVEPPPKRPLRESVRRLRGTLRELGHYRQATLMLVAFLVYNDGIATVVRMAAVYSELKGFPTDATLRTFLLVQFVGFPAAVVFGRLAEVFGPKRMVLFGLAVYVFVCLFALKMDTVTDLYLLGVFVGCVQGGCQALGRSLFARFVPKHRSGEFFALLAVGEKFAGVIGPLAFSLALQALDRPQPAILSLIPFFVLGAWLVSRIDVEAGRAEARRAELAFEADAAESDG